MGMEFKAHVELFYRFQRWSVLSFIDSGVLYRMPMSATFPVRNAARTGAFKT